MHADWALLPRGDFSDRANLLLRTKVELVSSFVKLLLDALTLLLVLPPVTVLTILVAIPNALAIPTLLGGITLLTAPRAQLFLGRGPVVLGVLVIFRLTLSFRTFLAERHGT